MRLLPGLVLLASVVGCTGGSSPPGATPAAPPTSQAEDDSIKDGKVGEFHDVYNTYASNPAVAHGRYAGRVLEGVLRVDAIDAGKAKTLLTQHTALTGDTVETLKPDPSKGVTAEFDEAGPVSGIKTGDRLRISCEIRSFEAGVLTLHRCQVVEKLPPAEKKKDGQPTGRFPNGSDTKSKG